MNPLLLEKIRTGQRFILLAILLYFGMLALGFMSGFLSGLGVPDALLIMIPISMIGCVLSILTLSIVGIFRICVGLEYSPVLCMINILLLFIPLIGLLILFNLSNKATALLKANGYKVGFLGAKRQPLHV